MKKLMSLSFNDTAHLAKVVPNTEMCDCSPCTNCDCPCASGDPGDCNCDCSS